jgi:hypothetical protein
MNGPTRENEERQQELADADTLRISHVVSRTVSVKALSQNLKLLQLPQTK